MKYRMLEKGEKIKRGDEVKRANGSWIKTICEGLTVWRYEVGRYRRPIKAKRKHKPDYPTMTMQSIIDVTERHQETKARLLEELEYRVKEEENRMDCLNFEEHEILGLLSKHTARLIWLHNLIDRVEEL